MEYHVGPFSLPQGEKSIAYYSLTKPKSLIIFIHGFGGSSISTWNNFPSILTADQRLSESDIIFYGYDSIRTQANNSGLRFYKFLKLHKYPQIKGHNEKRNVDETFEYERMILTAHSLGSIVVRKALLFAKAENMQWLNICRMVLFAPAHRGARIQNVLLECLPGISKVLAGFGLIGYPVLDDLRPNSQTILNLITDSSEYLQNNDGQFTIAHTVIWAGAEKVVHNDAFCQDPVADEIPNKTHTNVCKPKAQVFEEPFVYVINALN